MPQGLVRVFPLGLNVLPAPAFRLLPLVFCDRVLVLSKLFVFPTVYLCQCPPEIFDGSFCLSLCIPRSQLLSCMISLNAPFLPPVWWGLLNSRFRLHKYFFPVRLRTRLFFPASFPAHHFFRLPSASHSSFKTSLYVIQQPLLVRSGLVFCFSLKSST